MREWCAPGVRPGRGKGPTVRCQRSVLLTRTLPAWVTSIATTQLPVVARRGMPQQRRQS